MSEAKEPEKEPAEELDYKNPISMSDSAVTKIKELLVEEGNPNLKLRFLCKAVAVPVFSMVLPLMKRWQKMIRSLRKMAYRC